MSHCYLKVLPSLLLCWQALSAECCLEMTKSRLTDDSSPESWSSLAAGGEPVRDLVSSHVSIQLQNRNTKGELIPINQTIKKKIKKNGSERHQPDSFL